MNLLDYLRNPQTEQMTQQWGDRLEQMSIKDKLDVIWAIATNIGHCEQSGELKTLSQTQDEYGALLENCTDSETLLKLLEQANPSINDLLAVMACLSAHLHSGIYQETRPMKSRLAQLRSDLTFAVVLLAGALVLIVLALASPRPSPPSSPPPPSWQENHS